MEDTRPVNLDLMKMKFPPMAIVSILHRLAGVILFIGLPYLLYLLHCSLSSVANFSGIAQGGFWLTFFIWVVLSALAMHFFAGARHLLMDLGIGETKVLGRVSAWMVLSLSVLSIILLGVWLWL